MFGFSKYNYDAFRKEYLAKDFAVRKMAGPEPGEEAPDFELRSLDGDMVRLSDVRGEKNVVLTFGSATCPQTAASVRGLNELHEDFRDDDVEFFFVYVREAHPGERIPGHRSIEDKTRAAELFRSQEGVEVAILVDDLRGTAHRRYGRLPNPTFLIDKSGRISFRQAATRPGALADAIEELVERQEDRGVDHAIVQGGEDLSVPSVGAFVHSYRALERGGQRSLDNFREEFGTTGRATLTASRLMEPVALNPGKTLLAIGLTGGVVAGAVLLGRFLRARAMRVREPYRYVKVPPERTGTYDEPMGI